MRRNIKKIYAIALSMVMVVCSLCGNHFKVYADSGDGLCSHENREETGAWWYDFDEGTAVDNGDGSHTVGGYRITQYVCEDCGETIEIRAEELDHVTDSHYYYEGFCTICHSANPCDHTEGTQVKSGEGREIDEGSICDNGDGTHTVKFRNYVSYNCKKCDSEYTVYDEEWTELTNEAHKWHINGFCQVCYANNGCEHPNLEESELVKYGNYFYGGEIEHVACGSRNQRYVCTDCGMDYLEYLEECTDYEAHDFSNGDCICGACSHQNREEINSWKDYDGDTIVNNGDGTHTGTLNTYALYLCLDCGENFDRIKSVGENVTEKHEFDSDGICNRCDAQNICKHEGEKNYSINYYEDYDEEPITTDTTHTFPAYIVRETICKDCEQQIDSETIQDNPSTHLHYYRDGVCMDCGYTNNCNHNNQHEIVEFIPNYSASTTQPIEGTNLHTVKGNVVIRTKCLSCGETFEKSSFEAEGTERHYFENGSCYYCGYENTCEHKNIIEEKWVNCGASLDNGDEGHYENTWTGSIRYCGDCDLLISSETCFPITQELMPHYYKNGICTYCGHVNPCNHTNTKNESVREYVPISHNQTGHILYAQEQQMTICECGEIIAVTSCGEFQEITEEHSLYKVGDYLYCSYCYFSQKYPDNLSTLTLPAALKEISSEAFAGTAAEVIVIPEDCKSIASDAFDDCPNLVYIVNQSDVQITAPEGVKIIEE